MLRQHLNAVFIATCYKVYSPDEWDPIDRKYQGTKIEHTNIKSLFNKELTTQSILIATSFLGLPNSLFLENTKKGKKNYKNLSWLDIGKNLLGWSDNTHIVLNIIKSPFFFMWHAFWILPKLAINIAKIVTEFLPQFGATLCEEAANSIKKKDLRLKISTNKFLYGLAKFGQIIFESWAFIGRAITSPINAARKAWKMGSHLLDKDKDGKHTRASKILGGVLAVLSIGITAAFFAALFPLAIHALGVAVAQQLPVITHAISSAIHFLSPISFISQTIMPMITYASPALISACLIVGAAIPILGVVIGVVIEKMPIVINKIKSFFSQPPLVEEKIEKKIEGNNNSTKNLIKPLNITNAHSDSPSATSSGEESITKNQTSITSAPFPELQIVQHGGSVEFPELKNDNEIKNNMDL